MFMRACLFLLLGIAGSIFLTGCGEKVNTNTNPAAGGGDTLAAVKRAGVLKWGADANGGAPYVFGDPKNNEHIIGFEMDMMEKIAGHLGVKAERVQGEWAALPELLKDRADVVMNGYEINEKNSKAYAFSEPYFVYVQQLVVRAEDKDKYKDLASLKGQKIGILEGTESANVLSRAGFGPEQIVTHPDSKTPYENLKLKRVEAVLAESIINDYYAGKDAALYLNPNTFAPGKYGILMRKDKGSESLAAELNRILKLMKENGELAAIYKQWNILDDKQKEVGVITK